MWKRASASKDDEAAGAATRLIDADPPTQCEVEEDGVVCTPVVSLERDPAF